MARTPCSQCRGPGFNLVRELDPTCCIVWTRDKGEWWREEIILGGPNLVKQVL